MRRGLAAAAAAAVVALCFTPLVATEAGAQNAVTVTASPLTLSPAPGASGVVPTNVLTINGHFHVDGGFQPSFDWVTANLTWRGKAPGPQVPGPYTVCGSNPPSGKPGGACTGADQDITNFPLAPPPTYNGPYRVNATGHASDRFGASDVKTTNNVDFAIDAPPPNPTGVTATYDSKNKLVVLSWDRDATTPDVQSYYVYRKGPPDKDFVAVALVPQVASGARVTAPDQCRTCTGGDYVYQVETHRNGATGDSSSVAVSDRNAKESQSNKVTVPAPPPGQTVPTTVPSNGSAPPPVVRGTPSGVNRNSGFSGSDSSSAATTPTSEAVTPDPGFVRGLPYAGSNPEDQPSGEGDNSAVAVTPGRHKSSNRGVLVPVAGAGVLLLGALHLRLLKKRLDEPPSTLTPVT